MTPAITAREKASTADSIANLRAPGRSTTRNHIGKRISKRTTLRKKRPCDGPPLSPTTTRPLHVYTTWPNRSRLTSRGMDSERWMVKESRRERSEEHTSELQSLLRLSYAVFCLKKQ